MTKEIYEDPFVEDVVSQLNSMKNDKPLAYDYLPYGVLAILIIYGFFLLYAATAGGNIGVGNTINNIQLIQPGEESKKNRG